MYSLCVIDPPNEELTVEGSNKDTKISREILDLCTEGNNEDINF